ncbi:hypothetical protein BT96DRAFT_713851 [Gymnopus androsaceus JB14]|uniref:Uncharacterized protein n=1 Tax=Gymnopus androsaceus JB14 TaxID=1447944 RepID=A0A6A4HK06_9AGAR|nr:hypothetical protein BT96DRAFT_713851 [Gymnopus androsaceus JB14]
MIPCCIEAENTPQETQCLVSSTTVYPVIGEIFRPFFEALFILSYEIHTVTRRSRSSRALVYAAALAMGVVERKTKKKQFVSMRVILLHLDLINNLELNTRKDCSWSSNCLVYSHDTQQNIMSLCSDVKEVYSSTFTQPRLRNNPPTWRYRYSARFEATGDGDRV